MTNEERIQHLEGQILEARPRAEKFMRGLGWLLTAAAVLLGLYATNKALSVAQCVNGALASRDMPSATDNAAHIAFAQAVQGLFLPASASKAQQQAEVASFKRAVNSYVVTLLADQRDRNSHPLGKC